MRAAELGKGRAPRDPVHYPRDPSPASAEEAGQDRWGRGRIRSHLEPRLGGLWKALDPPRTSGPCLSRWPEVLQELRSLSPSWDIGLFKSDQTPSGGGAVVGVTRGPERGVWAHSPQSGLRLGRDKSRGSCAWESHPCSGYRQVGPRAGARNQPKSASRVVLVGVNALFNIMDCAFPVDLNTDRPCCEHQHLPVLEKEPK